MQLTAIIFSWVMPMLVPQEDKQNKQPSPFSKDEKVYYNRIVKDLLHSCRERAVELPFLGIQNQERRQTYVIVFQQPYSWREVERQLNSINANIYNNVVQGMTAKWKNLIIRMRSLQAEIHDYTNELRQFEKQAKNPSLLKQDLAIIEISKKLTVERISFNKIKIRRHLKEAKNDLKAHLQNPEITKYKLCKELLEDLEKNWKQFCVFSKRFEGSIDENKLCVQIRNSTPGAPLDQQVNMATRAIFLIEELEHEETIVKEGEDKIKGKMIRPTRVSLKKRCFGPATPSPINPVSSTIRLTKQMVLDVSLSEEDDRLGRDSSDTIKTVTSLAAGLDNVVRKALEEVNQKLSETDISLSDSDDDFAPSQEDEDFSTPNFLNRIYML